MTTAEMVTKVKRLLNRPSEDDLFEDPGEFRDALTDAVKWARRKIATKAPNLLYEEKTVTSSDGWEYEIGGDHLGEIEVWEPPGPRKGTELPNVLPGSGVQQGFYIQGNSIFLVRNKKYSPGLYLRWVPAEIDALDGDTDSPLPSYTDNLVVFRACYELSRKPGFLGDPQHFYQRALEEWEGNDADPSDMGVLALIARQAAAQGFQTSEFYERPWWRGIPQ